jgi:hypothetical protein
MKNSHDFARNNVSRRFMTVMFMVPKNLIKKRFQPSESQIEFRQEPAKTVAAITFGWADTKIEKYKEKLKQPWTLKE